MAEIKSTLEIVMERAARMSADAADVSQDEKTEQRGMRLAAAFLNGEQSDLLKLITEQPPEEQMSVRRGMVSTLMRNVSLPRGDDSLDRSNLSLDVILKISGNASDITTICSELQQILGQYTQHKEQAKQQLDEAIRNQLKQNLMQQGKEISDDMSLNPAMHPQYQEELTRLNTDLNDQYNQAIEQRKEAIRQRITG